MKKILITGGLGYIGTKFLDSSYENLEIHVFDTNYFTNKSLNNSSLLIVNDIRNFKNDYLEEIDIVVHMSELSNDPLGEFNPSLTNQVNHLSTKELLKKCNSSSIKKFIYMSSASVYGFNENILNEDSETKPLTQYAKSKVANERYILNNEFNFETVILRNSTVFGFSNNLRLDLVVNDLTYSAMVNKEIELISDGNPKRPFIHVQDLCNLIYQIINTDQNLDKEIINTGANTLNYSIKEIAEIVGALTGVEKIKFGKKDSDQRSYYLDFTKLNTLISDFKIQFDLHSGINDLIQNLKTYELSGNERRLQKLNKLIETGKLDKSLRWI